MGAKTSGSAGRRPSPAALCALALLFVLGFAVVVLVGPALADISPPTTTIPTTTSGPAPDPAPKTTTTTKTAAPKKAPAPAPKPQPTTSKPAPAPTPVHTSAPVSQPAPRTTSTPSASAPVVHRAVKRVHRAKAKVKAKVVHKTRRKARPVTTPVVKPKPHGVLGARATKPVVATRVSSPSLSAADGSSDGLRKAFVILLFGLPALVLGAALALPPHVVPHRMSLAWRNSRLNVGLLAASVLLVEALLYLLTR